MRSSTLYHFLNSMLQVISGEHGNPELQCHQVLPTAHMFESRSGQVVTGQPNLLPYLRLHMHDPMRVFVTLISPRHVPDYTTNLILGFSQATRQVLDQQHMKSPNQ